MLFYGSTALGAKKRFRRKFRAAVGAEGEFLGIGVDAGLDRLFIEALALLLPLAICLHTFSLQLQNYRLAIIQPKNGF
jgi:hypothetical protein